MALGITKSAAAKISDLISTEADPHGWMFRVMITGGGCAGFQYIFTLDKERNADDSIFEHHGVTVVVDEASLPFIEEAEIDYVSDMMGSSFQIKNPNANTSCGCGSSFSV